MNLTSRVGRRIFALFVLCALGPLALMLLLSTREVGDALIAQGERRLAADAKTYGSAAYGRLLDAASVAALAAEAFAQQPGASLALAPFESLALVRPGGARTLIAGDPPAFAPTPAERERLVSGRRVLRVGGDSADGATLLVAVPLGENGERGYALATVRGAVVWGEQDDWPAGIEYCVLDTATVAPLFCPRARPDDRALAALRSRGAGAVASFAWEDAAGRTLRSVAWDQFLAASFGTDEWIVVASEPEERLLASATAFRRVFVPVAALALFAVVWLSLRLIRATLTPLAELTAATRRVAGHDFAARVAIDRNDEFGELADAFNAMTGRIARQFAALDTLAEIDREILSHDLARVVRAVLRHMAALMPARAVRVVLLDRDDPGKARIGTLRAGHEVEPTLAGLQEAQVSAGDRALLARPDVGNWLTQDAAATGCFAGLLGPDVGSAYVHPIAWRDVACGALVFGFAGRATLSGDEATQVRELAARMAVAISAAWRDAELYAQAHFDALTGLPNRLLFGDRMAQQIARSRREESALALLFIDLDHFKNVNDTLGHSRGDLVLAEAAERLQHSVRACDTVARLGGDEFAVVLPDIARPGEVDRAVRAILASLALPFDLDGQQCFLGASVGVAVFPVDGTSTEVLLRNADTAMYRAKANGRGQVAFYEPRMNREALERVALDRELRAALAGHQFVLHYQPQLELASGRIASAEALVRWQHPQRGLLMPEGFIGIAEASGLIEDVGRWVIREACRQEQALRRQGVTLTRLAINASARELHHEGFVSFVNGVMREFGTAPATLEIEVTESLLIERVADVRRVLDGLKGAGLTVALDDFGVGFASMASLRDFPFDIVKIDKSFVAGLPACPHSLAIVNATLAISRALGKRVVAEGVENEAQLDLLRRLGCDFAQGYFVARPMPADAFERFMREAHVR